MRLTIERVRELLAVDGTRRMFGGVLMDAALVRDLAADLLDARASIAAERARCAAVCRDVAARERGHGDAVATIAAEMCAEAIERGAVTP